MSQADTDSLFEDQATEGAGSAPAVRSWSASSTTVTDHINARVDELEAALEAFGSRLTDVEMSGPGEAGKAEDQGGIHELRQALAKANATIEQLALQSQASLGFDAQNTFDCPSCGSHGTVAVPVSCTSCGHEAEWGFWPGQ